MSYWHAIAGGDRVWVTDEENEAATENPIMHPAFKDVARECEATILDEVANWEVVFDGGVGPVVSVSDAAQVAARMIVNQIAHERQQQQACRTARRGGVPAMSDHECVFVEEQEPNGRLILPPCLVCGLAAMDALEQLRTHEGEG